MAQAVAAWEGGGRHATGTLVGALGIDKGIQWDALTLKT